MNIFEGLISVDPLYGGGGGARLATESSAERDARLVGQNGGRAPQDVRALARSSPPHTSSVRDVPCEGAPPVTVSRMART